MQWPWGGSLDDTRGWEQRPWLAGQGASSDTPVTGDKAAEVTAAVKAKDSSVTVTGVRKDPDGSYDVIGTKSGAQVRYDVSADLKTVTQNTGHDGHGRHGGAHDGSQSSSGNATA
jgi:hypothetical protein